MSDKDKGVNVELFSLTYGSLVRSIVKETNNIDDANAKLAKIGVNIGNRITDDFVVHAEKCRFKSLREACEMLADYSFKTYLGINAQLTEPSDSRCLIRFSDNPITRYVIIPPEYDGLVYLMPLLSAIKTSLGLLHYSVDVNLVQDMLHGGTSNDIEIKLIEVMDDLPPGEYI